ncbi:UNVERIFIED_CONTAM: hypothetical protein PYX00_006072 [Menopon gallinae]|uniref:TIR domain-containing protein n=1 Tax=Menopon gallinae TaxID=328185 RepID=A0AAW2HTX8_9NEOP
MLLPVLNFPKLRALRELDLQSCRINYVEKRSFDFLDSLEKLDLSRNNIINLKDGWVETKPSVMYLNLSYNGLASRAPTINLFDVNHQFDLGIFDRLETLDVSNSDFWSDKKLVLNESNNLRRLSLCKCRLHTLNQSMFRMMTKLTEIDLSGNPALGKTISFSQLNSMGNLQKLHLAHTGIVNLTLDDDGRMPNVQHLDLSNNYIKSVSPNFLRALPRLTVLDLSGNSISCWPKNLLVGAPMLQSIFMDRNKIETLKSTTIDAIVQLREISLGNNPFLCGCYVLDFVKRLRKTKSGFYLCPEFVKETETARVRANAGNHSVRLLTPDISGTRRLYLFEGACALVKDWDESEYQCYSPSAQTVLSFVYLNESFEECQAPLTEEYFDWTYLAVTAALLACFFVGFLWWKWWNIRIFSELLTAAAVLGFANDVGSDEVHYDYDAFVSYTDSDRPWVIEELIPNLEKLQNVKICLHERDFQVGISILENIVTCIDKSRCIILVVSQAFVSSQWCQYEMHLAYHRLLETKRDRMILIFLENIPRYKRPKTLRYLMMTKTYIQWPSDQTDNGKSIQIFWNRLFRALLCDS